MDAETLRESLKQDVRAAKSLPGRRDEPMNGAAFIALIQDASYYTYLAYREQLANHVLDQETDEVTLMEALRELMEGVKTLLLDDRFETGTSDAFAHAGGVVRRNAYSRFYNEYNRFLLD